MKSVTVIVPTYNEAENVCELVRRLSRYVAPCDILVVDDSSPDGTADIAAGLGCRVMRRNSNRGLSASVVDGLKMAGSQKVAVIDCDLQHPPEAIPRLLAALGKHDFAVMSRYVRGGGCREWGFGRRVVSRVANLIAMPLVMFKVKDLASGFFGFRTEGLPKLTEVNTGGFKIMLELLVKGRWGGISEVPYTFEARRRGRSKMRFGQVRDYLVQLVQLYLYRFRWLRFGIIGLSGTLVYFPILYSLTEFTGLFYLASSAVGIICASTSNYFLNHYWTFRGQRQAGHSHLRGWLKYQAMSGITDGAYLALFGLLTELSGMWYMASAAIVMLVIFLLKYVVARHWIWSKPRPETAQ